MGAHGLERVLRQLVGVVRPLQLVDVEVASVTRRSAEPAERFPGPRPHVGGQDAAGVRQDRSRAAYSDTQVVQELRVDVVDRAGDVELDRRGEVGEDRPEPVAGRRLGSRAIVGEEKRRPGASTGPVRSNTSPSRDVSPNPSSTATSLIGRFVVAGQRVDLDDPGRGQWMAVVGQSLVDRCAGDDLVLAVAAADGCRPRCQLAQRQQRPYVRGGSDAGAERSAGEFGGEPRWFCRGELDGRPAIGQDE